MDSNFKVLLAPDAVDNGGEGSGNFGHSGRPGEQGGSGDGGGGKEKKEKSSGIKEKVTKALEKSEAEYQTAKEDFGNASREWGAFQRETRGKPLMKWSKEDFERKNLIGSKRSRAEKKMRDADNKRYKLEIASGSSEAVARSVLKDMNID